MWISDKGFRGSLLMAAVVAGLLLAPHATPAHCDTLDGPVIGDAKAALTMADIAPVITMDEGEPARPTVLVFGLGSRCRYCVQLKKEIESVTQTTGDAVRFREYLVNRDQEMVHTYRILLSPTLIFLDAGGAEVFRHQGVLDAAQIRERLIALKFWSGKG